MTKPPFNRPSFAPVDVELLPLADGGHLMRSRQALAPYGRCLGEYLEHWARVAPHRLFLAGRDAQGGWRELGFGEVRNTARRLAAALLARGHSADRPLAILSDNSIEQALLSLGAMHVGIPVAPISAAYSLVSRDHARLRTVLDLLKPGLVFVQDAARYAGALASVELDGAEIVSVLTGGQAPAATPYTELLDCADDAAVDAAYARLGPDTIAKILFASGSTGQPKGVINTQRMLCANQQAIAQVWPFLGEKPPVIVDWLPWSHTFGGNHNFNMMLRHGGSLYIDEGKPLPGLMHKTLANLREISPSIYFNVPRGYDILLPYLERDEALRKRFFRNLDLIFYAAAALPQSLWERLEAVAIRARGERITMVSAWGSTETAPMATAVHFHIERAGVIGVPAPGCEIKLLPNDGKLELRCKGPSVTPGYFRRDDLNRAAFDDDGFYRIGDAGSLADPGDPSKGLVFNGRIAEDFKLSSGTWVRVAGLRLRVIAAGSALIQDCVIAGHNRAEIGLLVFPNEAACRNLCPDAGKALALAALIERPQVMARMREILGQLARESTGSSSCPTRALLMADPPNIDANEITDKGYINQAAVLARRAALVERLYGSAPDAAVIRCD